MVVENEAFVLPFDHAYDKVLPSHAVAAEETVREGLVHVIGPLLEAVTEGLQVSTAKVVEPEAVQPLTLWVTVTV